MARAKSRVMVDPDPDADVRVREESSERPGEPGQPDRDGGPSGRTGGDALDPDVVARRAYERYESRGGQHGWDQDDWFEAERELTLRHREDD